jgi:hypothetical protein
MQKTLVPYINSDVSGEGTIAAPKRRTKTEHIVICSHTTQWLSDQRVSSVVEVQVHAHQIAAVHVSVTPLTESMWYTHPSYNRMNLATNASKWKMTLLPMRMRCS